MLAGDGGSTEVTSAKSILADEGNVQLPGKAQRTGTAAAGHGQRIVSHGQVSSGWLVGMSLLAALAPFGLALGVVIFIELLEIVALGLGIDPLVTAPDVVMMVAVMVLVIRLMVLVDLGRSLLLAELRLDGLERPREETGHNVFRMILEALPEAGHLEQTADAAGFASEDVIEHGSLAKDGELVAGALLLRIAQGEGIEDGSAAYQLRGCNLTHEGESWELCLLCKLDSSESHGQGYSRMTTLAIDAIGPFLPAVRGYHGPH